MYLDKRIRARHLGKSGRRCDFVGPELAGPRRQMEQTRRVIVAVLLGPLGQ